MSELSARPGPVVKQDRIRSIDTLRGVALLGILILNIIAFALPFGSYFNPVVDGATAGASLTAYVISDTFFEGSMRTIFSMLFGAGVILFTAKPDTAPLSVADLYFRRTILLILFGVIDAYLLLWVGDILYAYGVAGLFLYIFRNARPLRLFGAGTAIILFFAILHAFAAAELGRLHADVATIQAKPAAAVTDADREALAQWETLQEEMFEPAELNAGTVEVRKADYLTIVAGLAPVNLQFQTTDYYQHNFWDVIAMMLLGMAFMKWGVFGAGLSTRTYVLMTVVGLGVGLSVNYYEVSRFIDSGFATHLNVSPLRPTYDIGRLFVAVGYIGLVMLICQKQMLTWLRAALAAVGQMALTNYLSHSVICAIVFTGVGFGLVGELARHEIYYVVFAIWVFQLVTSPLWLRHFQFGPVEWLWRSLTYGERQPMRLR